MTHSDANDMTPTLFRTSLIATALAFAPYALAQSSEESQRDVRKLYSGRMMPDEQVELSRHIDRLFPTRTVEAAAEPHQFGQRDASLEDFSLTHDGVTYDIYDFMALNRVSGLIAVHANDVVFEQYALGNTPETPWMSMSIAKSISSTLIGAALNDGYIDSLDDPVTRYVPALTGSVYDDVTVEQILRMASGVAWDETYEDPNSQRRQMLEIQLDQRPGALLDFMGGLERAAEPGTVWNYSTGETQLLSAIVNGAVGKSASEYLSEKIWSGYGMAHDAQWWLDSEEGQEIGGSGLLVTLRDYARFGQFALDEYHAPNVLPEGWMQEAGRPHEIGGEEVEYGYSWWPEGDGAFSAVGIFGQWVFIDPVNDMVIAMTGAQPKAEAFEIVPVTQFFHALSDHLAAQAQ
ncbi:serine hydrolase domain-containing protein [Halomonas dongshanensis]|uniref:Beta-lactamase family protein n=1 Tax=Halomonas dongshanensis TaxID=2890835 RepID=A0ABT2EGM0_9GAMM|nr:serine hydrolase [Halomonas dongshanensis]MCS2609769.1 beta-lactamase family protein [Halomonas dongshanensis]